MHGGSAAKVDLADRLRALSTRSEPQRSVAEFLELSQRSLGGGSNRRTTRCELAKAEDRERNYIPPKATNSSQARVG